MGRVVRIALIVLLAVAACARSPLGRRQLKLFSDRQMDSMGAQAFQQLKQQTPASSDAKSSRYVQCVANAITRELSPANRGGWEVVLFKEPSANAFALPGRKIGVHTGLLKVARSQHQLATVIGHEVGHVLAGHANERMSTNFATSTGLQVATILAGKPSPTQQQIIGLLGAGAQLGIILPFSRTQESEADKIGLDLMASAGFDPRESVQLWKNMEEAGGGQPAELLSTHPSHGTRIQGLEERMPRALQLRQTALKAGKKPAC